MSAQEGGRSPTRQRGSSSPPRSLTPSAPAGGHQSQAAGAASSGAGQSIRKEPSLGVHAPGSSANPRRARSIHSMSKQA